MKSAPDALPDPMHDTPRTSPAPSARPAGRPVELALIAAVAANGVIGRDNALPWRLPEDLAHFRALTTGHAVIMGRRTHQSIGRALAQRQNIVVTRDPGYRAEGAEIAASLDAALARVRLPPPAFVIGGRALYEEALPRADTLHLTEIAAAFDGDRRFPAFDRSQFRESARVEQVSASGGLRYAFVTLERAAPPQP
jgi:dihydrofolate reductase